MRFSLFKISTNPSDVVIRRVIFPPFMWIILFPVCIFLPITLNGIMAYHFGMILFSFVNIIISCLLILLIPILLVKWNYYSKYPSTVYIAQGIVTLKFSRLFQSDKTIEITSQNYPTVRADEYLTIIRYFFCYYARVRVESTINYSTVIYLQLASSKEEAIRTAMQFAKSVSSKSGFALKV